MLVARSSRCATRNIARNAVSRPARATLATVGEHPADHATGNRTESNHLLTSGSRRVFFLRPWVGVPSMALGLAILRAFELQYGKLRDIRLAQDFEVPELYQSTIWANFEDDRDYDKIPSQEAVIKLAIPDIPKSPPGATSLAEVQPFLLPLKKADHPDATPWDNVLELMKKEDDTEPKMTEMEVKIGRSVRMMLDYTQFHSDPESRPAQNRYNQIGAAFCKWGGFYTPDTSREPNAEQEDGMDDSRTETQNIAPHMPYMSAAKHHWSPVIQAIAETERLHSVEMEQTEREQREQEQKEQAQKELEREEREEREQKELREAAAKELEAAAAAKEAEEALELEQMKHASSKPARQKRERLLALARSRAATPSAVPQPTGPQATAEKDVQDAAIQSKIDKEMEIQLTKPASTIMTKSDRERNRLAAIAHQHAHSPLPEEVIPGDPEAEAKAQRAAEEQKKADDQAAKATILGRLQKLWGW